MRVEQPVSDGQGNKALIVIRPLPQCKKLFLIFKKGRKSVTKTNGTAPLTALLIEVAIIIFPDGTTHHFKTKPVFKDKPNDNITYIQGYTKKWFDANKAKYELRGIDLSQLSNAIATIRMLESDFDKISKREVLE